MRDNIEIFFIFLKTYSQVMFLLNHVLFLLLFFGTLKTQTFAYKWKTTILVHKSASHTGFMEVDYLTLKDPTVELSSYASVFNFHHPSRTNTLHSTSHYASPYVIKVEVMEDDGKVSQPIMRSMLLNGIHPILECDFISRELDFHGGGAAFRIKGQVTRPECSSQNCSGIVLSDMSWFHPLPINETIQSIHLTLPTITTNSLTVPELKKVHHIFLHYYLPDGNLPKDITIYTSVIDLLPHGMDAMLSLGSILVFSADEFLTSFVKELQLPSNAAEVCKEGIEAAVDLSYKLIYFSKNGIYQFIPTANGVKKHKLAVNGNEVCALHVSFSVSECVNDILIFGTKQELFVGLSSRFPGTAHELIQFKEIKDLKGKTVCDFLSLKDCNIVKHTFSNRTCELHWKWYILVSSESLEEYYITEYSAFDGVWKLLKKFSQKLSKKVSEALKIKPYAFLDLFDVDAKGSPMEFYGMHTSEAFGDKLFLYGNVILVYTKISGILTIIWNGITDDAASAVNQIAFQKHQREFAFLTGTGELWHGQIVGLLGNVMLIKNSRDVESITETTFSNVLTIFYDSSELLYALTRMDDDNQVLKFELKLNSSSIAKPTIHRSYSFSTRLGYILRRVFKIFPPPRWPKHTNDELALRNFNNTFTLVSGFEENELIEFEIEMYSLFKNQKIGVNRWWWDSLHFVRPPHSDSLKLNDYFLYLSANKVDFKEFWYTFLTMYKYFIETQLHPFQFTKASIIYLDKNVLFSFNVTYVPESQDPLVVISQVQLFVSLSRSDLVFYHVTKYIHPLHVTFQVDFTGKQLAQRLPGRNLQDVSASVWTKVPNALKLDHPAEGYNFVLKVGCPPARVLKFDKERSIQFLAAAGRIDNFDCLYDSDDQIPCFTISEFIAAFSVFDHYFDEYVPFAGNFTFKIVGGGAGYIENVVNYTQEEIQKFNYRVNKSISSPQSLIWTILDFSKELVYTTAGEVIFDSQNPESILFECRLHSPCGSIPLGSSNPGEYFLLIEISNRGVDTSTNCDFTMRFMLHLVGIELNPRSHGFIVLVTVCIIIAMIFFYYQFADGSGRKCLTSKSWINKSDRTVDEDSQLQLKLLLQKSRRSSFHPTVNSSLRASLLAQSVYTETPTQRRKSLAMASMTSDFLENISALKTKPSIIINDEVTHTTASWRNIDQDAISNKTLED